MAGRGAARLGLDLAARLVVRGLATQRMLGRLGQGDRSRGLLQEGVQLDAQDEHEPEQIEPEREHQEHAKDGIRLVGWEQANVDRKDAQNDEEEHARQKRARG